MIQRRILRALILFCMIILSANLCNALPDLTFYPENFEDFYVVLGSSASPQNALAAQIILIANNITDIDDKQAHSKLDQDINDLSKKNLIVIGGPCDNKIAEILEPDAPCDLGISNTEKLIKIYNLEGKHQILIYANRFSIDVPAHILAVWQNYNITAQSVLIRGGKLKPTFIENYNPPDKVIFENATVDNLEINKITIIKKLIRGIFTFEYVINMKIESETPKINSDLFHVTLESAQGTQTYEYSKNPEEGDLNVGSGDYVHTGRDIDFTLEGIREVVPIVPDDITISIYYKDQVLESIPISMPDDYNLNRVYGVYYTTLYEKDKFPIENSCGDGNCETNENSNTCPEDCQEEKVEEEKSEQKEEEEEITNEFKDRCNESDGGLDYYTRGSIEFEPIGKKFDYCRGESTVMEYECGFIQRFGTGTYLREHRCLGGCKNGACVEPRRKTSKRNDIDPEFARLCRENDNGLDFYKKGTTHFLTAGQKDDQCTGNGNILEYYCENLHEKGFGGYVEEFPCKNGCTEGACIELSDEEVNDLPHDDSEKESEISSKYSSVGSNIPETQDEVNLTKTIVDPCNGCKWAEDCFSIGAIKKLNDETIFCNTSKNFQIQKEIGEQCINNLECKTNFCTNSECYDVQAEIKETKSLLTKVLDWISRVFGR